MRMTKQEMRTEINRIYKATQNNEDWITVSNLIDSKNEYIVASGYERYYLCTNTQHAEILAHLEAWINASYDVLGKCY